MCEFRDGGIVRWLVLNWAPLVAAFGAAGAAVVAARLLGVAW